MSISVYQVKPRAGQATATWTRTNRSYQRHFQVLLNEPSEDLPAICTAIDPNTDLQIPGYCSVHPYDVNCWVTEVRARCEDAYGKCWEVMCTYSNQGESEANPLARPPVLVWTSEEQEEAVDKTTDETPKALLNSANDAFDPPLTRTKGFLVLNYQINLESYDPLIADNYGFCVNDDTFFGWEAKKVLCMPPKGQEVIEQDITYWNCEFVFKFNPNGWTRSILDRGFRYKASDGKQKNIMVNGQKISSPKLLDGEGGVLADGDDPVFLDFNVYEEKDFSALDIFGVLMPHPNSIVETDFATLNWIIKSIRQLQGGVGLTKQRPHNPVIGAECFLARITGHDPDSNAYSWIAETTNSTLEEETGSFSDDFGDDFGGIDTDFPPLIDDSDLGEGSTGANFALEAREFPFEELNSIVVMFPGQNYYVFVADDYLVSGVAVGDIISTGTMSTVDSSGNTIEVAVVNEYMTISGGSQVEARYHKKDKTYHLIAGDCSS